MPANFSQPEELVLPEIDFDPLLAPGFFELPPETNITFPMPSEGSVENFFITDDVKNYQSGVEELAEKLKTWAQENSLTDTENIAEFVKSLANGTITHKSNGIEFSPVYTDGIKALYNFIEDLKSTLVSVDRRKVLAQQLINQLKQTDAAKLNQQLLEAQSKLATEFKIKFPLPPIDKVRPFLMTPEGELFKAGVQQLLNTLEKWAKDNEIWQQNNHLRSFFDRLIVGQLSQQDSKEYNYIYTDGMALLAKILKKIHSDTVPLERRKDIVFNLIPGFAVCGPGVLTHLENADAALSSDLPNALKNIRDKIVRGVINDLRQVDSHWDVFAAHEGMEIHQVNTVSNLHAKRLGIPRIIDGYAYPVTTRNHYLYQLAYENFPRAIAETLTAAAVTDLLSDQMLEDVMRILIDVRNDNIDGIKDAITATLLFYGNDETFDPASLILLDEDAAMEGRYELLANKIKSRQEIELILRVSLVLRLEEKKYFNLGQRSRSLLPDPAKAAAAVGKITSELPPVAHLPSKHTLKFSYVTLYKSPCPVIPLISYLPEMDVNDIRNLITNESLLAEALLFSTPENRSTLIAKLKPDFFKDSDVIYLINAMPFDTHAQIFSLLPERVFNTAYETLKFNLATALTQLVQLPQEATYLRFMQSRQIAKFKTARFHLCLSQWF